MTRSTEVSLRVAPILALVAACTTRDSPGGAVAVDPNPDDPFAALVRVSVDAEADVHVVHGEAGSFDRVTPAQHLLAGEEGLFQVLGLAAGRTHTLSAVVDDGQEVFSSSTLVFETDPLPSDWPDCRVVSDAPSGTFDPEEVVCSAQWLPDQGSVVWFCVDREGEPRWSLRHPDDQHIVAMTPLREGGYATASSSTDMISVFDRFGALTSDWRTVDFRGKTRFEHQWIDQHEVVEVANGPWDGALAVITMSAEPWDIGQGVLLGGGFIVFDPADGEVLYDWLSHGTLNDGVPIDPALSYDRRGLLDEAEDWTHSNALLHALDDDGDPFFLMSLRNQDWIVKIDPATDAIAWRLGWDGDFRLVEDLDDPDSPDADPAGWFYHQHSPELESHGGGRYRLLVLDNGDVRADATGQAVFAPMYSRAVEVEVDETTMRAAVTWSWGSPDEEDPSHFYTWGAGDANLTPDGARVQVASGYTTPPFLAEVDRASGEVVWRLECDSPFPFYRLQYFPSLYDQAWWYRVER
jgi:hypothetical protein